MNIKFLGIGAAAVAAAAGGTARRPRSHRARRTTNRLAFDYDDVRDAVLAVANEQNRKVNAPLIAELAAIDQGIDVLSIPWARLLAFVVIAACGRP